MNNFSENLISWYNTQKRDLPWRKTKNPYFIWLSEVILQQTRVNQGLEYYLSFINAYPTVYDLANASEQEVLKLWQGLGYYSRARNLHFAAKQIVEVFDGNFPSNYKDILCLKGVGDYTAAAIASFAFDLPNAVVDGNVYRVLSRYYLDSTPIDSTEGKKLFKLLAHDLLDSKDPASHNQAIMELGAMICKPKNPICDLCPVNNSCLSFGNPQRFDLPVKSKSVKRSKRYFYYLVMSDGSFFVKKREDNDIWKGLFDFPLVATLESIGYDELFKLVKNIGLELSAKTELYKTKHVLTHQDIYVEFWEVNPVEIYLDFTMTDLKGFSSFPLPRVIDRFLEKVY